MSLPPQIRIEIDRIAGDTVSGATTLVTQAIELLRRACAEPATLTETGRALCRAQPTMAGFYTAAATALAADNPRRDLAALSERIRRAPAVIAGHAAAWLRNVRGDEPLRLVTCSRSSLVERTLLSLRRDRPHVRCAESRPRQEGIGLAEALSAAGIDVTLYSDAGISSAVPDADALLVGADAVSATGIINKVGTAALAALARSCGIPVLVLAGQEKLVPESLFEALPVVEGPADELIGSAAWRVRNPYFERVSSDLLSQCVTDEGILRPHEVAVKSIGGVEMAKYMSLLLEGNVLDSD